MGDVIADAALLDADDFATFQVPALTDATRGTMLGVLGMGLLRGF